MRRRFHGNHFSNPGQPPQRPEAYRPALRRRQGLILLQRLQTRRPRPHHPGENEGDLLDITRQYYEEFCPEGIVETELVESKQEDPEHSLGASLIADSFGPNVLHKLFRRSQAAHRDWFRAETEIRRQAERLSRPANPEAAAQAGARSSTSARTASGFNPRSPHHPPVELCPSCHSMGRIDDRCNFQPNDSVDFIENWLRSAGNNGAARVSNRCRDMSSELPETTD